MIEAAPQLPTTNSQFSIFNSPRNSIENWLLKIGHLSFQLSALFNKTGSYFCTDPKEGSVCVEGVALIIFLPAPTLTGQITAGVFSLCGSGVAGTNFIIQASADLVTWRPLQTNALPFNFLDTNASAYRWRFYRAVVAH